MKRVLFFVTALAAGFTSLAEAADLAIRPPVAPPIFSWTGIYLGIGGGAGWGNKEFSWDQDATVAAIAAQMANPGAIPTLGRNQGSHPISGGFFGVQLGASWQVGWAVFGVSADAHWADINGQGSCFDAGALGTAGVTFACTGKVTSFGTATARAGAAVDRTLIYAKGGLAWERGQYSVTPTGPFNVNGGGNNPLASITAVSSSQSRIGWTFGAGVEYAIGPQWSAFIEYNYLDFGTKAVNTTHLLSLPNDTPASFVLPIQTNVTERFNVIKVGLNYKLDWRSTLAADRRL